MGLLDGMVENEVQEKNLVDVAYNSIRSMIVNGILKQGELTSVSAIAKKLNISRTPITIACHRLESEKFLSIVSKQGVIIKSITLDDAREIYELRAAIESYSAKKAFNLLLPSDVEKLKSSLEVQKVAIKNNDLETIMKEDIFFHRLILEKYENTHFFSIISTIYDRAYLIGIKACSNAFRAEQMLDEHRQMIDCIETNNKDKFVELIESNILNGYISLTGVYKY